MIALPKPWNMFFISSKKLSLFSRYSNFCIFIYPFFAPCPPVLSSLFQDKSWSLWCYQLSKWELNNTFCLISWQGKKVWHWNFAYWWSIKQGIFLWKNRAKNAHQKLVSDSFFIPVNNPKQSLHARNYFKNKIFWKRIIKNP